MKLKAAAKTQPTQLLFEAFLEQSVAPARHADCRVIASMMHRATGEPAVMWGSIVGFGQYHYTYESGHQGDSMLVGFAPRKSDIAIYIVPGFAQHDQLLSQLGKHKTGKSCLYVKSLAEVDATVLEALIADSVKTMRAKWVTGISA